MPFVEKAALQRHDQGLRNGVAAAGAADEHGVAIMYQTDRVVRRNHSHRPSPPDTSLEERLATVDADGLPRDMPGRLCGQKNRHRGPVFRLRQPADANTRSPLLET